MYLFYLSLYWFLYISNSFKLTAEDDDCISCICHAKTACYNMKTCAAASIDYPYFLEAYHIGDVLENKRFYEECMKTESCIITTIYSFINNTQRDCYCDELIDCRDKLSRHLYRNGCHPISNHRYERRYNNCANKKGLPKINSHVKCVDFEKEPFAKLTASYMWETEDNASTNL